MDGDALLYPLNREGGMMKRLAVGVTILVLVAIPLRAERLAFRIGAGPSFVSLTDVNAAVLKFNGLIALLNEYSDTLPTVTGQVDPLSAIGGGTAYVAGERYWITDSLAFGASLELCSASTAVDGDYDSDGVFSTIAVALDAFGVGLILDGHFDFLDAGVLLGLDLGIGLYYGGVNRNATFEIPEAFPGNLSSVPPSGETRYRGLGLGYRAGVSLAYPITDWLRVDSSVLYRSAAIPSLTDEAGDPMDLYGDGDQQQVELGGITVQFGISISIDLSPNGEKE